MSGDLPSSATGPDAAELLQRLSNEFAVVENPAGVYPPYELYPLPPKQERLTQDPVAILIDLDGTIVDSEPMYVAVLEEVARAIVGADRDVPILDETRDHPNLVGGSVTAHAGYLWDRFGDAFDAAAFHRHVIAALRYNFVNPFEEARFEETRQALHRLRIADIQHDRRFTQADLSDRELMELSSQYRIDYDSDSARILGATQFYYHRLYIMLQHHNRSASIQLTPGATIFHAIVKGVRLEMRPLADHLMGYLSDELPDDPVKTLERLSELFLNTSPRVAVVTSSTGPEADALLKAAFQHMQAEAEQWPVRDSMERDRLRSQFAEPYSFYEAVFTASDVPEMRLKPHRDLYSLALAQLGIGPDQFHRVLVLEDSPVGVTAARAAGCPLVCAMPLPINRNQSFPHATHVVPGGLPELLLEHGGFLVEG